MKNVFKVIAIILCLLPVTVQAASFFEDMHFAAGIGGVVNQRAASGEVSFNQYGPEIFLYGYKPIGSSERFSFRPALRLGYAGNQPDMPSALRITERDFRFVAEGGLVWEWIVVPSLSVGVGTLIRSTSLVAGAPIDPSKSEIGGVSVLPLVQAQFGVGIPIERGLIVLEPYGRYQRVFADARFGWAGGVEFSMILGGGR